MTSNNTIQDNTSLLDHWGIVEKSENESVVVVVMYKERDQKCTNWAARSSVQDCRRFAVVPLHEQQHAGIRGKPLIIIQYGLSRDWNILFRGSSIKNSFLDVQEIQEIQDSPSGTQKEGTSVREEVGRQFGPAPSLVLDQSGFPQRGVGLRTHGRNVEDVAAFTARQKTRQHWSCDDQKREAASRHDAVQSAVRLRGLKTSVLSQLFSERGFVGEATNYSCRAFDNRRPDPQETAGKAQLMTAKDPWWKRLN